MAWFSQHMFRLRSSVGLLKTAVARRALSSQAGGSNWSFLRSTVVPCVLGASVAAGGVFAAKKLLYLQQFHLVEDVHAATVVSWSCDRNLWIKFSPAIRWKQ